MDTPSSELVNTNGAFKVASADAGCGGVLWDISGRWISGFSKCIGLCNVFVAELWGVYEGLKLCYSLGHRLV